MFLTIEQALALQGETPIEELAFYWDECAGELITVTLIGTPTVDPGL